MQVNHLGRSFFGRKEGHFRSSIRVSAPSGSRAGAAPPNKADISDMLTFAQLTAVITTTARP